MKFLPCDSFTIQTNDPLPTVVKRLQSHVMAPPLFSFLPEPGGYYGHVDEVSFKIYPKLGYRNAFLPIICGQFREEKAGAVADVYMRLQLRVAVFIAVFVAILGMIVVVACVTIFVDGGRGTGTSTILIIPAALLAALAVMVCGGFWFEARHVQRHLTGILTGTQSKPRPIAADNQK